MKKPVKTLPEILLDLSVALLLGSGLFANSACKQLVLSSDSSSSSGSSSDAPSSSSPSALTLSVDGVNGTGSYYSGSNCVGYDDIDASGPAPGSAPTALASSDYAALSSQDGAHLALECITGGTASNSVVEFDIPISSADLAQHTSVTPKFFGLAGEYGTLCDGRAPTGQRTVSGYMSDELDIYDYGASAWVTVGAIGLTDTLVTDTLSPLSDYVSPDGHVHLRAVGGSYIAGGDCSSVQVDYAGITLNP